MSSGNFTLPLDYAIRTVLSLTNNMPDKEFIIWFAGLLDGDGYLRKVTSKSRWCEISIIQSVQPDDNDTFEVLSLIQKNFGGKVIQYNTGAYYKDGYKRKPQWKWYIYKKELILPILKSIEPYLKIKKNRAITLIKYLEERR